MVAVFQRRLPSNQWQPPYQRRDPGGHGNPPVASDGGSTGEHLSEQCTEIQIPTRNSRFLTLCRFWFFLNARARSSLPMRRRGRCWGLLRASGFLGPLKTFSGDSFPARPNRGHSHRHAARQPLPCHPSGPQRPSCARRRHVLPVESELREAVIVAHPSGANGPRIALDG